MGAYVDVNGRNTYYEVVGEGEPVVLVNGTGGSAGSWIAQRDLLPDWYRLYVPECDDIAGFVEALGLGPVRLVGWSRGARVVLRLALRRPELVSRLVLIAPGGSRLEELEEIALLSMPLLVMQSDDDPAEIAQSAALAGTAPDGRLAVVPGTSHLLPLEKPELVNLLLLDFFEDKPAARFSGGAAA